MNRADQKVPQRKLIIVGALITFALLLGVVLNQKKADDIVIPVQSDPEVEESIAAPVAEKVAVADTINVEEENPQIFRGTDEAIFEEVDLSMVDDSAIQKIIGGAPVNRYRVVKVNTDILRSHIRNAEPNDEIFFHLFDDTVIRGVASFSNAYGSGERQGLGTWGGSIDGDLKSVVTVVVSSTDSVSITISGEQGSYDVRNLSQGPYHIIADYDFYSGHHGDGVPNSDEENEPTP